MANRTILGRLTPDELVEWRHTVAAYELALSPTTDLTAEDALRYRIDYYETVERFHDAYHVAEEDRADVTISLGSGLIILEED